MKFIISPSKNMNDGITPYDTMPVYLEKTEKIVEVLRSKSTEELQSIWNCSNAIAEKNARILLEMNLHESLMPAIQRYTGLQYQYLDYCSMDEKSKAYLNENLYILSSMYGILRPRDGISSYRLDYNSKLQIGNDKTLYEYWNSAPATLLEDDIVINLASKEYSNSVIPYLKNQVITITFLKKQKGKYVTQSTFAKMLRGLFVQFAAEKQITDTEQLKTFTELNLRYCEERSSEKEFVFVEE